MGKQQSLMVGALARRLVCSPATALSCIVIAHVLLSALFALTLPALESYDEPGHYAYTRYIARNARLPARDERLSEADESHQPPLYYALIAPFIAWIDTSDDVQATPIWATYFSVRPDAALNDFWRGGTALAIRAARIGTALLSSLSVVLTYLSMRLLSPGRPWVWLVAAGIHAFWPMFVFMSGVISNDNGVTWTGALTLYAAARLVAHRRTPLLRDYLFAAAAAALATLMKDSGIVQTALLLLLSTLLAATHALKVPLRALLYWGGCVALAVALIAAGAAWSNGRSARQLQIAWRAAVNLATTVAAQFTAIFADRPSVSNMAETTLLTPQPHSPSEFALQLRQEFEEFFGVFNRNSLRLPAEWYRIAEALAIIHIALIAWRLLTTQRNDERLALLLLGSFILFVIAAPAWRSISSGATWLFHGRFILPCVSAMAGIVAVTLAGSPLPLRRLLGGLTLSGLAWISLAAPPLVVAPIFQRPVLFVGRAEAFVPPQQDFSIIFGDGQEDYVEMVGYLLPSPYAHKGGVMEVFAFWRALQPIPERYMLRLEGFSREGLSLRNAIQFEPAQGGFPTTQWRVGEIYGEGHYLFIWDREAFESPFIGQFKFTWINARTGETLIPRCAGEQPCDGKFGALPIRISQREAEQWRSVRPCCHFGLGVSLAVSIPQQLRAGETLTATLLWRSRQPLNKAYTVFFQLLDLSDQIVAQHDSPPREGQYPTTFWSAGDIVPETRRLSLPADLPSGEYRLAIGMYDAATGERLTTTTASSSVTIQDNSFRFNLDVQP